MHPFLLEIYNKTIECFKADHRVLAAYMTGSAFTPNEDELSDVDPTFFIKTDHYSQFHKELPGIFRRLCDKVIFLWPERFNCQTWINYAVIFEHQGQVLQYDITIEPEPQEKPRRCLPGQLIFDKTGLLLKESGVEPAPAPTHQEILHTVETYWLWSYIQVKYFKRKDFVKLLYVQQELFNAHLKLMCYLNDPFQPLGWWCSAVKSIKDPQCQQILLSYLAQQELASFASKIERQIAAFTGDTQRCCSKYNMPYPVHVNKINEYLQQNLLKLNV